MRTLCFIAAIVLTTINASADESTRLPSNTNSVVFRQPFTLKLHVDKAHYYEQKFSRIPYVFKGDIYLFKDDSFGIDLQITNGLIQGVSYQSATNKAAVTFRFSQEVKEDGSSMMLLVIANHTKHDLFMDALMTVPGKEKPQKTSILPVKAGLSGYESWPHPIVQLVLRDVRFTDKRSGEDASPNRR